MQCFLVYSGMSICLNMSIYANLPFFLLWFKKLDAYLIKYLSVRTYEYLIRWPSVVASFFCSNSIQYNCVLIGDLYADCSLCLSVQSPTSYCLLPLCNLCTSPETEIKPINQKQGEGER